MPYNLITKFCVPIIKSIKGGTLKYMPFQVIHLDFSESKKETLSLKYI
jgi:hypothetical protein